MYKNSNNRVRFVHKYLNLFNKLLSHYYIDFSMFKDSQQSNRMIQIVLNHVQHFVSLQQNIEDV